MDVEWSGAMGCEYKLRVRYVIREEAAAAAAAVVLVRQPNGCEQTHQPAYDMMMVFGGSLARISIFRCKQLCRLLNPEPLTRIRIIISDGMMRLVDGAPNASGDAERGRKDTECESNEDEAVTVAEEYGNG